MALPAAYTIAPGRIPDLFAKIRDGQAPDQFSLQLLKDWGLSTANDRALLPILKAIGFLSDNGKPTQTYHEYRDHSRSKKVLGRALRQNFSDIFLIKENPTSADKEAIQGKFKSFHNTSDHVANLMTKTFLGLLTLADLSPDSVAPHGNGHAKKREPEDEGPVNDQRDEPEDRGDSNRRPKMHAPGLHYNIQIHLPATKDIEVYNSIFKSLKGHLFEA